MRKKILAAIVALSLCLSTTAYGQDPDLTQPGARSVTVGETTVTYVLPTPPTLTLTPPTILSNPPSDARLYPLMFREQAPYNGVLFNGPASAWLEAERTALPRYLAEYQNAITAQMVAWTYMELEQTNLRLATEREDGRIRQAALEREIALTRRLSRRSVLRPVLLVGFIVLTIGAAGTATAYVIGRNH